MPDRVFRDRRGAGRISADLLDHHPGRDDAGVLALPPGAAPVAFEVARTLEPLERAA